MRKINFLYVIAIMIMVVAISFLSQKNEKNDDETIKVALVVNQGFTVNSKNPIELTPGEPAIFDISIHEDYFFRETEGVKYEEGKLIFDNITRSKNIYFKLGHNCTITVADSENGTVEIIGENKRIDGSMLSVRMIPNEHYKIKDIEIDGVVYPPIEGEIFEFVVNDDCIVKVCFIGEDVNFMPMSNNLGTIKIQNQVDAYHYGDVINLECDFPENVKFEGWSLNGYIDDGGTIVEENSTFKYIIKEDTILYANFRDVAMYYIFFDANYGIASKDLNMECSPNAYVNLPVDTGVLTREGYMLIGYNTSPDGSGKQYQLGAMLQMPRDNIKLYASWEKHTPDSCFVYTIIQNEVIIQGISSFSNAISTLCIPEKINGRKVTEIADNAFRNNNRLKKVIIPTGVLRIGERAFANCIQLELVYVPETLTSLADNAFSGSENFSHLKIIATKGRAFDYDYDSILADKYMKLKGSIGKRIILVGGSNLTFGINSVNLKERFSDYDIVNLSGSYHYGMLTLFELLKANVREGDIVIFCPEYYHTMYGASESNEITNWQYIESNYDILNDIDIRDNPVLLSQFVPYLKYKNSILPGKLKNSDSVYIRSGANSYGDLIVFRTNKTSQKMEIPSTSLISDSGMKRYNALCKNLTKKGAVCLFSFPPTHGEPSMKTNIALKTKEFMELLQRKLNPSYCTVISSCEDYLLPSDLFYDSEYHLTLEGASERTNILIKDLEKFGIK